VIRAESLTKRFALPGGAVHLAVNDVSFEATRGEIVGLLGPNGAGKTTTMRMLATLLSPDSGRAVVAGHDLLGEAAEVRRSLGYLSSSTGLYARLTPRETLRYIAVLQECPDPNASAERAIARFGIGPFADKVNSSLSTGMKQKVSIARAVVHEPPVLIFDEPTSGLDVMVAQEVFGFLEHARSEGRCVLYSTHAMAEVERLCDRVVVIHDGRVRAQGTVRELCEATGVRWLEEAFLRLVAREPER
jgi:sodium transport system ATP-binding protein